MLTVTLNGVGFSIPEPNDTGYGVALDNYLKALATAFLPLGGGTNTLAADLDTGASFGLKSIYFATRSASPAASGLVRVANAETAVAWRNAANSGDVGLSVASADNRLSFNGVPITQNPMLDAATVAGQSITNGATEIVVVFGTATTDSDAALNTGTGRYTIPAGKGGHYLVTAQLAYNTAPGGTCTASIYKNAAVLKTTQFIAPAALQTITVSAPLLLAAGDIIDIRTKHGNAAAQSLVTTAGVVFFGLKRVPT